MPSFNGGNGAFTPSTSQDNYTLDAGAAGTTGPCRATAIAWGGSNVSSQAYRTRWTRPSTNGTSTFTAITLAAANPKYATAAAVFGTYVTAPTLVADPGANLYATDWNNQGGSGILILPLAQPWWILTGGGVNSQQLSCRNTKGTDALLSSYQLTWEED
jgi:hypothetical protein